MKVCAMLEKQSVDEMLLKAKSYANNGDILEAQKLYQTVLEAKKELIQQELATLNKHQKAIQTPPQETLNQLANLYKQGQFHAVVQEAQILSEQYPQAFVIWNLLGASATQIVMSDQALHAYKEAISIKPNYAKISEYPQKIDLNYNQIENGDLMHANGLCYDRKRNLILLKYFVGVCN